MKNERNVNYDREINSIKNLLLSGMSIEDEKNLYLYLPVEDKSKCLKMKIFNLDKNKFCVLYGSQADERNIGDILNKRFTSMAEKIVLEGAKLEDFLCEGTTFTYEKASKLREANRCIGEAFKEVEKLDGYDLMSNSVVMTNLVKSLGNVYSKEVTLGFERGFCLQDNHNNYIVYNDSQIENRTGNSPIRFSLVNSLAIAEKVNVNIDMGQVNADKVKSTFEHLKNLEIMYNAVDTQRGGFLNRLYFHGKKTTVDKLIKAVERETVKKVNAKKREIKISRLRPVSNKTKALQLTQGIEVSTDNTL